MNCNCGISLPMCCAWCNCKHLRADSPSCCVCMCAGKRPNRNKMIYSIWSGTVLCSMITSSSSWLLFMVVAVVVALAAHDIMHYWTLLTLSTKWNQKTVRSLNHFNIVFHCYNRRPLALPLLLTLTLSPMLLASLQHPNASCVVGNSWRSLNR